MSLIWTCISKSSPMSVRGRHPSDPCSASYFITRSGISSKMPSRRICLTLKGLEEQHNGYLLLWIYKRAIRLETDLQVACLQQVGGNAGILIQTISCQLCSASPARVESCTLMKGNLCGFWANKALGQAVACEKLSNASNLTRPTVFSIYFTSYPPA